MPHTDGVGGSPQSVMLDWSRANSDSRGPSSKKKEVRQEVQFELKFFFIVFVVFVFLKLCIVWCTRFELGLHSCRWQWKGGRGGENGAGAPGLKSGVSKDGGGVGK